MASRTARRHTGPAHPRRGARTASPRPFESKAYEFYVHLRKIYRPGRKLTMTMLEETWQKTSFGRIAIRMGVDQREELLAVASWAITRIWAYRCTHRNAARITCGICAEGAGIVMRSI